MEDSTILRLEAVRIAAGLKEPEGDAPGMQTIANGKGYWVKGKSAEKLVADAEKILKFLAERGE